MRFYLRLRLLGLTNIFHMIEIFNENLINFTPYKGKFSESKQIFIISINLPMVIRSIIGVLFLLSKLTFTKRDVTWCDVKSMFLSEHSPKARHVQIRVGSTELTPLQWYRKKKKKNSLYVIEALHRGPGPQVHQVKMSYNRKCKFS